MSYVGAGICARIILAALIGCVGFISTARPLASLFSITSLKKIILKEIKVS